MIASLMMNIPDNFLYISYETVRKIFNSLDRYEFTRRRYGRRDANRKNKPRMAGVRTTRPLERVEIDHFLLDVFLLMFFGGGFHIQRPWLTIALDHFTGAIIGYHLSFAPPSAASVLAVLRHAVLPKDCTKIERFTPKETLIDFDHHAADRWPCFGIPALIAVDNGLDLTSKAVSDACMQMGTEIQYCPPREPWYKGSVERFGRTLNQRLIHRLPGTTLGQAIKSYDYDPKSDALIHYDHFAVLLEHYIVNIHNHRPRRGHSGTPMEKWAKGIADFPPRVPVSIEDFDATIAITNTAKLHLDGIVYEYLKYNNVELGALCNRIGEKKSVIFKVDPLNIERIFVIDPLTNNPITVECTTAFEYPPILAYHLAVVNYTKNTKHNPSNAAHLTNASNELQRAMSEAAEHGKKALRRQQVEFLRLANSGADNNPITTRAQSKGANLNDLKDLLNKARSRSDE